MCTFLVKTPQKKSGFISCIYRTMKSFKINWFFRECLLNREAHLKSSWNQYIDTLICNSSLDKLRTSLRSQQELNSYVEVHKYLEPHSFLSLSLHHPKYTYIIKKSWSIQKIVQLSFTFKTEKVACKFCTRKVNDIVWDFIIDVFV